jgi:hypothetical protein
MLVALGLSFRLPRPMRAPHLQALVQVRNTSQPDRLRLTRNSEHLPSPAQAEMRTQQDDNIEFEPSDKTR